MKVFQVLNGICFWDGTEQFPALESTEGKFAPDILFVEAPDYVFEGWGYDPEETGDNRFIKPTPPEGWLYDDETGTFYPEGELPPSEYDTEMEKVQKEIQLLRATVSELQAINNAYLGLEE